MFDPIVRFTFAAGQQLNPPSDLTNRYRADVPAALMLAEPLDDLRIR